MKRSDTRKWTLIAIGAGLLCLTVAGAIVGYGWYVLTTRHAVRALPRSASEVQEYYVDSGFPLYDYEYKMKARMPEEAFPGYVKRMGFRRLKGRYGDLWYSGDPPWWDPSPSMSNTYGSVGGDDGNIVKWENGFVYYISWET